MKDGNRRMKEFITLKAHFAKLVHDSTYATRLEQADAIRMLVPLFEDVEREIRIGMGRAPLDRVPFPGAYGADLIQITGTTCRVKAPEELLPKTGVVLPPRGVVAAPAPLPPVTAAEAALDL